MIFVAKIHFGVPADHSSRQEGMVGGYVVMYGRFGDWPTCDEAFRVELGGLGCELREYEEVREFETVGDRWSDDQRERARRLDVYPVQYRDGRRYRWVDG